MTRLGGLGAWMPRGAVKQKASRSMEATAGAEAPPGRRARRRLQARAAILEAAMELFEERGLYTTRVEDITERADVAKGAFYSHFETKDALIADLVRQGVALLDSDYLSRVPADAPPEKRVADIVRRHHSFFEDHPGQALLFHQARGLLLLKHEGMEPLREAFSEYLLRLARRLGGTREGGERELGELAAVVGGAIVGYRSLRSAAGRPIQQAVLARALTAGVPDQLR
jgi:AcrR family transcriptional regulator